MEKIRSFYLFNNLDDKQFQRLKEISVLKQYKKGSIVFYEGEIAKHLILLTKGILQIYKSDHKGNKIVLHVFYPPNLIAEIVNFEQIPYPASGEFLTEGELLLIDYKIFEEEFLKNPEIAFTIIKSLTNKIRYLEHVITNDLVLSSTARVAKFIYEHEEEFMDLKKNEIATLLNITPETLSRIISKFKKLGLLEKNRSQYKVLKKEEFRSFFE
ncbi:MULTISPECIES: Crp/Fnr family transcriptional regulator [unclassified Nitratiruptor]|uniref:Crp/Fnr family transcriptional regulator n=1 Tax=unclassified Nitratiruptor TaxID=2624044 RepID=UPI0019153229|nr:MULTISPECIES: Crp/Fnr family transcriptional regulator [unclassified Nitratiruptor]BCD61077.1 transcriptional regulator, Crp/Fnr family [Nitratiruptor sp. YY08-10]BCD65010.1 transcriptional regulator, Crp/Fnr family [Nitratiruptor sp. YY08-14]